MDHVWVDMPVLAQKPERVVFPFSAIVALDKLKLAILINAINPKIGGILIRGPKGSGKTTVVRGLTDILPSVKVVKGCPFNCNPFDVSNMCPKCNDRYKRKPLPVEEKRMAVINLPLGATEDRVVGSLDIEKAIKLGVEALEPGILAEANQNILYVDEINLLPDHTADDLLDAAASGWNIVEREGISVSHPSRFIFVGTMNPEEGQLRPQLLDRFPLSVNVEKISSFKERAEVVRRNIEFEKDPEGFRGKFKEAQDELKTRVIQARNILSEVKIPEQLVEAVCKACLDLKVDGMRPDIVITKAACTVAAFDDRTAVTSKDVLVASELVLSHRTRQGGFLEAPTPDEIHKAFMDKLKETDRNEGGGSPDKPEIETTNGKHKKRRVFFWPKKLGEKKKDTPDRRLPKPLKRFKKAIFTLDNLIKGAIHNLTKHDAPKEARALNFSSARRWQPSEGVPLLTNIKKTILKPFELLFKVKKPPRGVRSSIGRRAETVTTLHRGRLCGWRFPDGKPRDVHLPATIRVAAKKQKNREKPFKTALSICLEDVREKLRLYRAPMTIVFLIDLSRSMIFNIEEVKEAILKLHRDAYRYRDKVGVVALKGRGATVVQHPIANLRVVANKLLGLGVAGSTPLAAGMLRAMEVLKEAKRRDRSTIPVMVIVTDGNANIPLMRSPDTNEVRTLDPLDLAFFDCENLAVNDVALVSKMIRRKGIFTVVVDTNPAIAGWGASGHLVTKLIASITNGAHHEVGRSKRALVKRTSEAITQDQRQISSKFYQIHHRKTACGELC